MLITELELTKQEADHIQAQILAAFGDEYQASKTITLLNPTRLFAVGQHFHLCLEDAVLFEGEIVQVDQEKGTFTLQPVPQKP